MEEQLLVVDPAVKLVEVPQEVIPQEIAPQEEAPKDKEIYIHNRALNKTRVTVCGVFSADDKRLVISGVSFDQKTFRRSLGREAAHARVALRPLLAFSVANIADAYSKFRFFAKGIIASLESNPVVNDDIAERIRPVRRAQKETLPVGVPSAI